VDVPATLEALFIAIVGLLPGATCAFAYESRVGSYGSAKLPDRIVRFLAISAGFQAATAGLAYHLYKTQVATGRIERGDISPWAIEAVAVAYMVIPFLIGWIAGTMRAKRSPAAKFFAHGTAEPRAWDFVASKKIPGLWRLRLKSGGWVGGAFATSKGGVPSYMSAYGEEGDVFFSTTVVVDPDTGEFKHNGDGEPELQEGGVLIRWNEVEFAQIFGGQLK
jgi:hypothetical protein